VHSIGITGHIHLTRDTMRLVREMMTENLSRRDTPLHGITCLAPGADELFVDVLKTLGGTYDVVLPARDYRRQLGGRRDRRRFDSYLDGARDVFEGPFGRSGPAAYAFANARVVERCQELIAVWDGAADEAPGSTAHAVALAQSRAVPVRTIWPDGAQRSRPPRPARRLMAPLAVRSATT
jgi:hypothetical protein